MTPAGFVVALFFHVIICTVTALLLFRGRLRVPGSFLIIVLLIPVAGFISMMCVEVFLRKREGPHQADDLLVAGKGDTPYGIITVEDGDPSAVVPLEEALVINDAKTRRAILQDILRKDPVLFMELLKVARLNEDMEVTHYATTTIMEIQRDFELSLQKLDREMAKNRDNGDAARESLELLEQYVSSGLLDGYSQQRMRLRYSQALERHADEQEPDRLTLLRMAANKIGLGDTAGAVQDVQTLLQRWPDDEEAWYLGLKATVESRDSRALQLWLERMVRNSAHWSAKSKEALRFWVESDSTKPMDAQMDAVNAQ